MASEKIDVKSNSTFRIIKESFINACSNTTAHALPKVFSSEHLILKIIWFVLFVCGIGGCVYYFYDSLYKFFLYEVSVSVKWNEMTLQVFPAVTFCNINPFDSSNQTIRMLLESNLTFFGLSSNITSSDDSPAIYQVNQAMKVLKATSQSGYNSNTTSNLGWDLSTMLISCYFNGAKCTSSDFTKSYYFEYGYCYTFNNNAAKSTSKTGQGLSIELFTGFPDKQDYLLEQRGVYLAVHNSSQKPILKFEGIKLPVGFSSNVGIKRTFSYRKEAPYSNCRVTSDTALATDSDFVKKTLNITKYSKKLCNEICIQNLYIVPGCGCSDPSVPDSSKSICSTLDRLDCVEQVRNKFDSDDLSSNCSSSCPTECDRIFYETSVSSSNYPTSYYYDIVSKQSTIANRFNTFNTVTFDLFKESVLMVNVFYQELGYTSITESPLYDGESIFATIGGQLGFLLGISLLSFCEILIFCIEIIIKLIQECIKKKKINV